MALHVRFLNSARHYKCSFHGNYYFFIEFAGRHVCSSLMFVSFIPSYESHMYIVEFISSEMSVLPVSLLLGSLPWQLGKWRTRKIGPVVSEGEENPSLLWLPAPCSVLCSSHLSTWLKHCVFTGNTIIGRRWLNIYPTFLELIVEVNHRKICCLLCCLILRIFHLLKNIPAPQFLTCPNLASTCRSYAACLTAQTLSLGHSETWLVRHSLSPLHVSIFSERPSLTAFPLNRQAFPSYYSVYFL